MMNLCSNARDALPPDLPGSIDITLERLHPDRRLAKRMVGAVPDVPCAAITVTDTGSGIAESDLARIFEPFQTTKIYGTGLGLAVVAAVVEEAGGSIHVRSGKHGTMFQIIWPLSRGALGQDGQEQEPAEGSGVALPGARILIVDDNPSVLDLVASEVRNTAAMVTPVNSPLEALAALRAEPASFDAVILDYDMPDMNGAQLAARIRESWPALPIVLCTALHELELDASGSLFDHRVAKSAISTDLVRVLDRLLSGSRIGVT